MTSNQLPRHPRLSSPREVVKELARLYREGKHGHRDVVDVSRLANVLQIMARIMETSDLEQRITALETTFP